MFRLAARIRCYATGFNMKKRKKKPIPAAVNEPTSASRESPFLINVDEAQKICKPQTIDVIEIHGHRFLHKKRQEDQLNDLHRTICEGLPILRKDSTCICSVYQSIMDISVNVSGASEVEQIYQKQNIVSEIIKCAMHSMDLCIIEWDQNEFSNSLGSYLSNRDIEQRVLNSPDPYYNLDNLICADEGTVNSNEQEYIPEIYSNDVFFIQNEMATEESIASGECMDLNSVFEHLDPNDVHLIGVDQSAAYNPWSTEYTDTNHKILAAARTRGNSEISKKIREAENVHFGETDFTTQTGASEFIAEATSFPTTEKSSKKNKKKKKRSNSKNNICKSARADKEEVKNPSIIEAVDVISHEVRPSIPDNVSDADIFSVSKLKVTSKKKPGRVNKPPESPHSQVNFKSNERIKSKQATPDLKSVVQRMKQNEKDTSIVSNNESYTSAIQFPETLINDGESIDPPILLECINLIIDKNQKMLNQHPSIRKSEDFCRIIIENIQEAVKIGCDMQSLQSHGCNTEMISTKISNYIVDMLRLTLSDALC